MGEEKNLEQFKGKIQNRFLLILVAFLRSCSECFSGVRCPPPVRGLRPRRPG